MNTTRIARSARIARLKKKLFEKTNGHCEYCHQQMIWWHPQKGIPIPDNACTIDHLYFKLHPLRRTSNFQKGNQRERRLFLVCFKCNQKKCREENKSVPLPIRWERGKQEPLYMKVMRGEMSLEEYQTIVSGLTLKRRIQIYNSISTIMSSETQPDGTVWTLEKINILYKIKKWIFLNTFETIILNN